MKIFKVGARVHAKVMRYKKLVTEWDGYIVQDCSHFGDGKKKLWGVDRVKSFNEWERKKLVPYKQGCMVFSEDDLKLL